MWQRQVVLLLASTTFIALLFHAIPPDHRDVAMAVRRRDPARISPTPSTVPSAEWGEKLYPRNACPICHGVGGSGLVDGATSAGPKLAGISCTMRPMSTGESIRADARYLRESMVRPGAHVVAGYTSLQMPAFALKDAQLDAIVAYLGTLK